MFLSFVSGPVRQSCLRTVSLLGKARIRRNSPEVLNHIVRPRLQAILEHDEGFSQSDKCQQCSPAVQA